MKAALLVLKSCPVSTSLSPPSHFNRCKLRFHAVALGRFFLSAVYHRRHLDPKMPGRLLNNLFILTTPVIAHLSRVAGSAFAFWRLVFRHISCLPRLRPRSPHSGMISSSEIRNGSTSHSGYIILTPLASIIALPMNFCACILIRTGFLCFTRRYSIFFGRKTSAGPYCSMVRFYYWHT